MIRVFFLISHWFKWSILNQSQEIKSKMRSFETEYQSLRQIIPFIKEKLKMTLLFYKQNQANLNPTAVISQIIHPEPKKGGGCFRPSNETKPKVRMLIVANFALPAPDACLCLLLPLPNSSSNLKLLMSTSCCLSKKKFRSGQTSIFA